MIRRVYKAALCCALCLVAASLAPAPLSAQTVNSQPDLSIAVAQFISEQTISYGDLLAYDRETDTYRLTREINDPDIHGVAAERPLLVFRTATNTVPVLREGRTLVNVVLENGAIAPGDPITSSSVSGKGMRASVSHEYIIGRAVEPLTEAGAVATTTAGGQSVFIGTIMVAVDLKGATSLRGTLGGSEEGRGLTLLGGIEEATVINLIQYLVAAFIAVGSVYIAFRNFMPSVQRGIISVGRNPRAKSSIQSMVLFNAFLIVVISAGGFLVALGILLLPF